jgi:hypothetical protein
MVEWRENPYPRSVPIDLTGLLVISLLPLIIILIALYFYSNHIAMLVIAVVVPLLVVLSIAYGLYQNNRANAQEVGTSGFGVHFRYLNGRERMIPWNEILYLKVFILPIGQPKSGVLINKSKFIIKNSGIWGENLEIINERIESNSPKQKPLSDQIVWMDNTQEKSEKGFYWSSAAIFSVAVFVYAIIQFFWLVRPGRISVAESLMWIALLVVLILLANVIVYAIIRYNYKVRPKKVGLSKNGIHLSYKNNVENIDWADIQETKFHIGDGFPNSPLVGRIKLAGSHKQILLRFEIAHEIDRNKKAPD